MQQAFILGAGLGTRLRPLTASTPKPLVPVFHRPMVEAIFDRCLQLGIHDIAINTHHCPDAWLSHFPTHQYKEASLTFFHEEILLDTGGGLKNIQSWVKGPNLLVHNGDIFSDLDLAQLIQHHKSSTATVTLALRSQGPNPVVAWDASSTHITDIRHLLGRAPGHCQFTGIYCVSSRIFDFFPNDAVFSIIPVWLDLIQQNAVAGCLLDAGNWLDLGTIEAYQSMHFDAPTSLKRIAPSALISPSASVDAASWIGPEAQLGDHTKLTRCIVWPKTHLPAGSSHSDCILFPSPDGKNTCILPAITH